MRVARRARCPTATSAAATGCRAPSTSAVCGTPGRRALISTSKMPAGPARRRRTPRAARPALRRAAAAGRRGPPGPTSGFDSLTWNARARWSVTSARRPCGIGLQRTQLVAGEQPPHEGMEAGDAQAFGAGEGLAGGRLDVVPVGAGAGVEQHADDREVDHRAGAHRGLARRPAARSSCALRSTPPASKWRQRLWNGMCSLG